MSRMLYDAPKCVLKIIAICISLAKWSVCHSCMCVSLNPISYHVLPHNLTWTWIRPRISFQPSSPDVIRISYRLFILSLAAQNTTILIKTSRPRNASYGLEIVAPGSADVIILTLYSYLTTNFSNSRLARRIAKLRETSDDCVWRLRRSLFFPIRARSLRALLRRNPACCSCGTKKCPHCAPNELFKWASHSTSA